jgi:xanthine dehydrogenase YagR molybdenum-binding subunit
MPEQTQIIGEPIDRVDGRLKVTGGARYSYEMPVAGALYGVLVMSAIPAGKIASIDTSKATDAPGVVNIMTYQNAPKLPDGGERGFRILSLLQDQNVYYDRQPIGVVIADTFEHAVEGAKLVDVQYTKSDVVTTLQGGLSNAYTPNGGYLQSSRGDINAGLTQATVKVDETYTTPIENHNPMEPHATIASWDGDKLTLYEATQGVFGARGRVASAFEIDPANVRVVSYFIGGGFGCKGTSWSHSVLTAMAAKMVGKPVKLTLTRDQMFGPVGFRPATIQQVTLGATSDGILTALRHNTTSQTSVFDEFVEPSSRTAPMIYSCPNCSTSQKLVKVNAGTPTFMRAPGESSGSFALESAMDELSYALKMDPIDLRLKNYAETDPSRNLPWSSKSLRECYQQGAERFGWKARNPQPGSMKNGDLLVGWGMATSTYPTNRSQATCKAIIYPDGSVVMQAGTQDIGTGTYTVMSQVAAQQLGVPFAKVRFDLGDTDFPENPNSGGSQTAASTGSGVYQAASDLRDKIIALAIADPNSPLRGHEASEISVGEGRIFLTKSPSTGETYADLLKRQNLKQLDVTSTSRPGEERSQYSMHAFGAQFCEVQVDPDTYQIRITRWVGSFGVGHLLNAKTARSQMIGGIIFGIGMGLTEATLTDSRYGRVLNADLAEYHLPVNADVPDIDIIFVPEDDHHINPLGIKGIGEIGITGVAAAIANAVYHATGRRVRDLPITLDKVMG